MTVDRHSWGYRRNVDIKSYLTIAELLSELASTVRLLSTSDFLNNIYLLRLFLTIALRILSAHNLWRHLARSRARAHRQHGGFALILSSFS